MNKQIGEWPVSLVVAVLVTVGCGFVFNTYFSAMMDDLSEISLPMVACIAAALALIGIWAETIKSYKLHKEEIALQAQRLNAAAQGKVHWPEPKKDSTPIEPEGQLRRVFKIDE